MTRREWLGAAISTGILRAAAPDFERIDTHNHIHRPAPVLTDAMKRSGWRGLSICDSREIADQLSILPDMKAGTKELVKASGERWCWATTFDARGFERTDFREQVTAALQSDWQQGAVAVKIWKNVGLATRGKDGKFLMPDDARLQFVYELTQGAGRTLLTHLADPDQAWLPLDPARPDSSYYRSHPEWYFYGKPGAPSKESILQARDRVLARFPKLQMVGCHIGSNEDNLKAIAARLDRFPNFAVDLASRVRNLALAPHAEAKEFLERYQERLLYATDFTLGTTDEAKAADSLLRTHEADWQLLAGSGTVTYGGRETQGFGLSSTVLRKIFRDNALRWIPMPQQVRG